MKKILSIALTTIIIGGGIYYFTHSKNLTSRPETQTIDTSTWKTYENAEFGFSIKYPPSYVVQEDSVATGVPWTSRGLVTISRSDTPPQSVRPTSGIVSAQVTLQRQPVIANGKIYHTVAEYQKSGTAAQLMPEAPSPNGELVTVNSVQALAYHLPPGDIVAISSDSYFFIKNDIVYEISFSGDDPNGKAMLQSITWQ